MSHYFINDPGLAHDLDTFPYDFDGKRYWFASDAGVFSKGHVDMASDLLIRHMPEVKGRLLDMGCGYGCIGIVLGKAYGTAVTLVDVNERALALARLNAKKNGVDAEIICSDCFTDVHGEFDVIVTNPPIRAGKQVVFRIYEGARAHLKNGGALYVVIQDKHGAGSSEKKIKDLFGACEVIYKRKGFRIFKGVADARSANA